VLSAAHAMDRRMLEMHWDHRMIDLTGDERYGRVQVFLQHREFLDTMWRVFCKTVPSLGAAHKALLEKRDFEALRLLRAQERADAEAAAATQRTVGAAGAAADGEPFQALQRENELLRHQVQLLERRVASRVQSVGPTLAERRPAQSLGRMPSARDLEVFSAYLCQALCDAQDAARAAVTSAEEDARANLDTLRYAGKLELDIRTAQRTLLLPQFQGYRPKVPPEHSLAPDEYLRKLLVAQTCKHYDDSFVMLQQHENGARNGLEDLALTCLRDAHDCYFAPIYAEHSARLEARVQRLERHNAEIEAHVHDLALTDKLALLQGAEANTRDAIDSVRATDLTAFQVIATRLETVEVQARKVGALQRKLEDQARRHKRETAVLATAIPKGTPGVPYVHTPLLALETRIAFSQASAGEAPRPATFETTLAPSSRTSRPSAKIQSAGDGAATLPPVVGSGSLRAHPPSAADYQQRAGRSGRRSSRPSTIASERNVEQMYFSGYL
jgi:hypothetical protein